MRRFATLTLIAAVFACSSDSATAPDRPVTGVTVDPASAPLILGQSVNLTATVTGGFATTTVVWTSLNPAVATVDDSGKVVARAIGATTVTATAGAITATVPVTVTPGAVDRVSVCNSGDTTGCAPSVFLTAPGTSVAARATAYNAIGFDISSACTFTWTPNTPDIVTITFFGGATNRDALITRVAGGTTSIIVSCGGTPGVFTIN